MEELPAGLGGLAVKLQAWNQTYETVRPHQALGISRQRRSIGSGNGYTPKERRHCPLSPDPVHSIDLVQKQRDYLQ